jgi:RimJ/RimL family protein N-acetyltransferase
VALRGEGLTDGVVTLRPLTLDDVDDHLAGEDAELVRWLNGGPGTRETVERYVRCAIQQWTVGGPRFSFAITSIAPAALVGTIDVDIDPQSRRPRRANLAYGLYPRWRRHGYASRAVRLAVTFLRAHPDRIDEAVISAAPANPASSAVARRAGFRHVGTERSPETGAIMDTLVLDLRDPGE